jgi:hypothetical protein
MKTEDISEKPIVGGDVELTIGVSIVLVIHAPGKLSPEAAFNIF